MLRHKRTEVWFGLTSYGRKGSRWGRNTKLVRYNCCIVRRSCHQKNSYFRVEPMLIVLCPKCSQPKTAILWSEKSPLV